jgi:hypothetical protein
VREAQKKMEDGAETKRLKVLASQSSLAGTLRTPEPQTLQVDLNILEWGGSHLVLLRIASRH